MLFRFKKNKLRIGLMGLAAKPIPAPEGNICAPNDIVYQLALGLKKHGHEVFVFTGEDSSKDLSKVSAGFMSTWNQYGTDKDLDPESYKAYRIEYESLLTKEAIKYYKDKRLDLINSHDFRTSPALFSAASVPVLYTVHSELKNNPMMRDEDHLNLLKGKNFGFLNISHDNEAVCRQNGLRNVAYTPNGVDTQKFSYSSDHKNGLLIVARMVPGKRIKEAIDIATKLSKDITLAGPGGELKEEKEYFEELRLNYFNQPNVKYVGYLSQEEIVPLYQKSSVLLLLSESEGMPLSVLEAQATGLPVVATREGGIKDIVIEGKTGYLVNDIRDKEEVIEKIKMAERLNPLDCRKNIESKFSYEIMVTNYMKAYYKFLGLI